MGTSKIQPEAVKGEDRKECEGEEKPRLRNAAVAEGQTREGGQLFIDHSTRPYNSAFIYVFNLKHIFLLSRGDGSA